jgi:RNA polymerase sigma-70 factor, ECF subfamily
LSARRGKRILWVGMSFPGQFEGVLAAARSGAEWAIAVLYREFQPGLLRYLMAQAPTDGEDLASEVWLAAAAGLARFEGDESAFRRWLFTIARRRVIDLRRRDASRRSLLGSLEHSSGHGSSSDPEAEALSASGTAAALALIAGLPPDQAEVVLLRVVGGLDTEDVAAIVGKKPGAVRVLQHRALKRLAEQLAQERGRRVTR